MFERLETVSNHGTNQGIIPRFNIQMDAMVGLAFGESRKKLHFDFLLNNIVDFTDFYDIHSAIHVTYKEYIAGLHSGKYFTPELEHSKIHDRGLEIELARHIKNFFILGKQLLNNFAKSGLIDDGKLKMSEIMFAKKTAYDNKRKIINELNGHFYEILFRIMDNYRERIIVPFFDLRNEYEHSNFKLGKFKVFFQENQLIIEEPELGGLNLVKAIDLLYEEILNYIELLIVYFYGLNAYRKTNGFFTLFESNTYNYAEQKFRYYIYPKMGVDHLTQLIKP
jgi:hypothetical protein